MPEQTRSVLHNVNVSHRRHYVNFARNLTKILGHILPHLEGPWSGAAFLAGSEGALELAASQGDFDFGPAAADPRGEDGWLDDSTYQLVLTNKEKALGRLFFHAESALRPEGREDFARTLAGISRLLSVALSI